MAGLGHDDEDFGGDPVGLSHHDQHSNPDVIDYRKIRSPSIPELQEGAGSMTDEESPYRTVPATQSQLAPLEDQPPRSPRSQEGSMTGSETSCGKPTYSISLQPSSVSEARISLRTHFISLVASGYIPPAYSFHQSGHLNKPSV